MLTGESQECYHIHSPIASLPPTQLGFPLPKEVTSQIQTAGLKIQLLGWNRDLLQSHLYWTLEALDLVARHGIRQLVVAF